MAGLSDTEDIADVNAKRRVVINRYEIVYGNTPIGLRRKQVEKMARELNVDVPTFCRNILSLTNEQRFLLLKNYYEKLNKETEIFYTKFKSYETYPTQKVVQKQLNTCESSQKKSKSSIRNDIELERTDNKQISTKRNIDSETRRIDTHIPNNSDRINMENRKLKKINTANYSQLTSENTATTINKTGFESVITSILLNDSDSKLKQIMNKKSKNKSQSPKKYDTMLESLLFG